MTKSRWYTEQPTNRNFLAPAGFKMNLDIFAGVDFFCQSVNLPDISVSSVEVPTRFRGIALPSSGGVAFGDLRLKFLVDEDMKNYMNVWKWINQNNLAEELDTKPIEYSNAQLQILNSNYQPNIIIIFENIFPIELSELSFDVEDENVDYLTASAIFKFTRYTFNNKNNKKL